MSSVDKKAVFTVYRVSEVTEAMLEDLVKTYDLKGSNPRRSMDGSLAIATGVFTHPDLHTTHYSAEDAEALMATSEWTDSGE